MKAVIIAAGYGSRLGEETKEKPKGLLDINGISIIERQVSLFKKNGIRDIIIITGPFDNFGIEGIKYVKDEHFDEHDVLGSLMAAKRELTGEIITSYSDIVFEEKILLDIIKSKELISIPIDLDWEKSYIGRTEHPKSEADNVLLKDEQIIEIKKGIEVGHIFQLGKVYTDAMKANVLDNEGKAKNLFMGCYGIGVSRLVAAAIEQNNDEKGIVWPEAMTPFEVNIVAIGFDKDKKIAKAATDLYNELSSMGYEVMLDDRKDGYGIKMKDAELIGIPINIIIGKQYLQNNEIELKHRDGQSSIGKIEDITTIFEHYKSS